MVFLIVLCGVIISLTTDQIFADKSAPPAFFIWPPFAFYRILTIINTASFTQGDTPYTFARLTPGDEVRTALIFLTVEIFVYGLIALYLEAVLPKEFGIRKPWHFPITDTYTFLTKPFRVNSNGGIVSPRIKIFILSSNLSSYIGPALRETHRRKHQTRRIRNEIRRRRRQSRTRAYRFERVPRIITPRREPHAQSVSVARRPRTETGREGCDSGGREWDCVGTAWTEWCWKDNADFDFDGVV